MKKKPDKSTIAIVGVSAVGFTIMLALAVSLLLPVFAKEEPKEGGRLGSEILKEMNAAIAEESKYLNMGRKLMDEERYEEAIETFKKNKQYGGSSWRIARYKIIRCYENLGDYANAISYLEGYMKTSADWSKENHLSRLAELKSKLAASNQP
jgi:tetratricopeptide (TPR) repeat protein